MVPKGAVAPRRKGRNGGTTVTNLLEVTIKLRVLLVALVAFGALVISAHDGRAAGMKEMLGSWYAEVQENKTLDGKKYTLRRQIELNRADGSKVVTFRYYAGKRRIGETIVTYKWGAEDNVYWAVCQSEVSDGRVKACSWRTEYDILSVDDQTLRYKSRSTGTIYNHKRVDGGFRLP